MKQAFPFFYVTFTETFALQFLAITKTTMIDPSISRPPTFNLARFETMEVVLNPKINLPLRYLTLGILLLPILLAFDVSWWQRMIACAVPLILTGTYRISTIDGDQFTARLYFAFIPMKAQKCNLPGVIYVETKYKSASLGTFLIFFVWYLIDMLIPAIGGAYEIWLVTAKGREFVAWQGFNEEHFDENLDLLSSRSGGEIRRRSR